MQAKPTKAERRTKFYPDSALAQSSSAVAYPLDQCHEEHHRRRRVLPRFSEALVAANYRYRRDQWKAQQIVEAKPVASNIVACRIFDKMTGKLLWSFASTPAFLRVWKEDGASFEGVFTPRKKPLKSAPRSVKSTVSLAALVESHETHMDQILGKTYSESQSRPGFPWKGLEGLREEAEELGEDDIAAVFQAMLEEGCKLSQATDDWRLIAKVKTFYSERLSA